MLSLWYDLSAHVGAAAKIFCAFSEVAEIGTCYLVYLEVK